MFYKNTFKLPFYILINLFLTRNMKTFLFIYRLHSLSLHTRSKFSHQHGKYPASLRSRYITRASNSAKGSPVDLSTSVSIMEHLALSLFLSLLHIFAKQKKQNNKILRTYSLSRTACVIRNLNYSTSTVRTRTFADFSSGERTHDRLRLPKVTEACSAAPG